MNIWTHCMKVNQVDELIIVMKMKHTHRAEYCATSDLILYKPLHLRSWIPDHQRRSSVHAYRSHNICLAVFSQVSITPSTQQYFSFRFPKSRLSTEFLNFRITLKTPRSADLLRVLSRHGRKQSETVFLSKHLFQDNHQTTETSSERSIFIPKPAKTHTLLHIKHLYAWQHQPKREICAHITKPKSGNVWP